MSEHRSFPESAEDQIQNLMKIPVNSATLPTSQQLEQVLLSRNPNQIAQTSGAYTALYGPVPAPTAASPQILNMVDMTDAAAQAAMKRAIEIDALADLELQAANQLNQSIQAAAPGSAPIIEAQADAWLIRANAYARGLRVLRRFGCTLEWSPIGTLLCDDLAAMACTHRLPMAGYEALVVGELCARARAKGMAS